MENKIIKLSRYLVTEYEIASPLKLQKLLYFIRKEEILDEKLNFDIFEENYNFEAGVNGPVNAETYTHFRKYFNKENEAEEYLMSPLEIDSYIKDGLDHIIEKYKSYDSGDLVAMTKKEKIGIEARKDDNGRSLGVRELCTRKLDEKGGGGHEGQRK